MSFGCWSDIGRYVITTRNSMHVKVPLCAYRKGARDMFRLLSRLKGS